MPWPSIKPMARSAARRNPSQITVGWTFCSMRSSLRLSNSPERITAEVVPSKQCCSWVFATSMIILAAGCSMSISLRMVAPSLVMTTSPMESTSILSMPLGPRVERTASATALAAAMLLDWAVRPRVRCVPSFKMKMGACPFPYMVVPSGMVGEVACALNPTLVQRGRKNTAHCWFCSSHC